MGERIILKEWVKKNPKDSRVFKQYRAGILDGSKDFPGFKSITSDKPRTIK